MSPRSPGRPRDPAIARSILAATRELILEVGQRGLSMEAVAARAGVSKPTLYLRYPTKSVLIAEAVFGQTRAIDIPEDGSLFDDLVAAYRRAVALFATPEARATLPVVFAELASDPDLLRLTRDRLLDPEFSRLHARLDTARSRGEIRADADLTMAVDAFLGAVLVGAALFDRRLDDAYAERMVDLVVNGLRPR